MSEEYLSVGEPFDPLIEAGPEAVSAPVTALQLSPALRRIAAGLSEIQEQTSVRVADAIRAAIVDYRRPSSVLSEDLLAHCRLASQVWLGALIECRQANAEELSAIEKQGAYKAAQGVSLAGLQQAWRIGSRIYWQELVNAAGGNAAVREELLSQVSHFFLHHFDAMGQAVSRGYYAEQQRRLRWSDRLRHQLGSIIYGRSEDTSAFAETAVALGVDPASIHVAIALRADGHSAGRPAGDTTSEARVASLLDVLGQSLDSSLWIERHGQLLVWIAIRGDGLHADRELANRLCREPRMQQSDGILGIGLPDANAAGFRRSGDQALKALELAGMGAETQERVHCYADVAIHDLVLQNAGFASYCEKLGDRLAAETGLLETLSTYFAQRMHRKPAAAALGIHPNTLSYRLDRIENLIGARLDDPSWITTLSIVLKLLQVSESRARRH